MTRIADAQRRAGRIIDADAEAAWEAGWAVADAESAAPVEPIAKFAMHAGKREGLESRVAPRIAPAAAPPDRSRVVPRGEAEVIALARQLFDAPPVGAAARTVLFCRDTSFADPVVRRLAEHLAQACPAAKVAVVAIDAGNDRTPRVSTVRELALSTEDARRRCAELKETFDFVLFDVQLSPADPNLLSLASHVDGVVVVIAEDVTRRARAKGMVEILQRSSVRIFGAVLTNQSYPIPQGIYERL